MRTILIALILICGVRLNAQDHKVEIKTSAICEMCQYAIEKEMAFEKGVKSAELDLDTKILTVFYKPKKTNADKIRKRVSLTGYHADSVKRDPEAYEKLPDCCKDGAHANEH